MTDIATEFGDMVRLARGQQGMNQRELALRMNVASSCSWDASAVSRVERGHRVLRLDDAVHLSRILKIDLGGILHLSPESDAERARRAGYEAGYRRAVSDARGAITSLEAAV